MKKTLAMALLFLSLNASAQVVDADGDSVPDDVDNCLSCWNYIQLDEDGDGLGDCWACDWCDGPGTDTDWDGVCDGLDNCPYVWNASQADSNNDGIGNACPGYVPPPPPPVEDAGSSEPSEDAGNSYDAGVQTTEDAGPPPPPEEICVFEPFVCSSDADCTSSTACINNMCVLVYAVCYTVDPPVDAGTQESDAGAEEDAGNNIFSDAGVTQLDAGIEDAGVVSTECSNGKVRYASSDRHSPIACGVLDNIQSIADNGLHDNAVFMKVGDSITANGDFMGCFATENPSMAAYGLGYLQPTVDHFLSGNINPYTRQSLAALSSQSADWAFSGSPSPILQELNATDAAYAVVMFGTNDLWWGGGPSNVAQKYRRYTGNMWKLVEQLTDNGVVPVLSTIPPHNGLPSWFHDLVPTLNDIVRGLAENKQIPYMNLYDTLLPIPNNGLGGDGIHLNRMEYNQVCNFSETGLDYGYNNRNLLTIESLDRVYNAVAYGDEYAQTYPLAFVGEGTASDPVEIDEIPFTASFGTSHAVGNSCASNMSGAAYELTVSNSQTLRLLALTRNESSPTISITDSSGNCVVSSASMVERTFGAGTYNVYASRPSGSDEVLFVVSEL